MVLVRIARKTEIRRPTIDKTQSGFELCAEGMRWTIYNDVALLYYSNHPPRRTGLNDLLEAEWNISSGGSRCEILNISTVQGRPLACNRWFTQNQKRRLGPKTGNRHSCAGMLEIPRRYGDGSRKSCGGGLELRR